MEKIVVVGSFINYNGTTNRNYLIRLNTDGTTDTAFCANASDGAKFSGPLNVAALQPDGKIIVSGSFTNYAGTASRSYLVRLNTDGTTDTTFCANASDTNKFSANTIGILVQANGQILLGGNFLNYGGVSGRSQVIRLNSDGTLDTTFCANAVDGTKFNAAATSFSEQSDGMILIGGGFTNYNSVVGRGNLIRVNADGTLDTAFCVNASDGGKFLSSVNKSYVQTDGRILIVGNFTSYGVVGRSYLVRLNTDGTTDTAFCVNASDGTKLGGTAAGIIQVLDSSCVVSWKVLQLMQDIEYDSFPCNKIAKISPSGNLK